MRRLVWVSPLSLWVLGASMACSVGDIEGGPFSELEPGESKGDDPTPTGGVLTTGITVDPGSAGGDEPASGSGGAETDGGDTDAPDTSGAAGDSSSGSSSADETSTTDAPAGCGDGMVDDGESCDGDNLADTACADVGDFSGGTLACDAECAFDTTGCTTPEVPFELCEAVNVAIPDAAAGVVHTLSVPEGGTVGDVRIGIELTHTFIGDLSIDVTHAGTTVRVYDEFCGTEENMDLVYDDAGAALSCAAATTGANTIPQGPLSAFDSSAAGGSWDILVADNALLDTGSLVEVCVYVTYEP